MSLIYAIGDIHGRYDLLLKAMAWIDEQIPGMVVQTGDLVDRGPHSKEVVQYFMDRPHITVLKGNHEEMMHDSYFRRGDVDKNYLYGWLQNGGHQTVASYGVDTFDMGEYYPHHLDWMRELPTALETENHIFVHAGLMPGTKLTENSDLVRLWVRSEFLGVDHDFGKHIVHGHTPTSMPEKKPFRTNLDLGAFHSGKLAVGVFDDSRKGGGPIDYKIIMEEDRTVEELFRYG